MFPFNKKPSFYLLLSRTAHSHLSSLHRFSTLTPQNPPPKPCFMAGYLINSLGFPSDKAIKASKYLSHIKSPSQPDKVLHFLRDCGFTDAHIRTIISNEPRLLTSNVESTLKPKFRLLQEMGISQSDIIQLVSSHPQALKCRDLRPKMELLRSVLVVHEDLQKVISKNHFRLNCSYANKMLPNISLLRECNVSDRQIGRLILKRPRFISSRRETVEAKVRMAQELGAASSSAMFWQLLWVMLGLNKAMLSAKFKLLKELGWSEADISTLCASHPTVLLLSEKNVRDKMSFFTKEVGCEPSFVARRPDLLTYCLEGRLVPRHSVLRLLKKEGLFQEPKWLISTISNSEKKFVEKFVIPYEEKVPGLREAYAAGLASEKTK